MTKLEHQLYDALPKPGDFVVLSGPYGHETAKVVEVKRSTVKVARSWGGKGYDARPYRKPISDVILVGTEAECDAVVSQLSTSREVERAAVRAAYDARRVRDELIISDAVERRRK